MSDPAGGVQAATAPLPGGSGFMPLVSIRRHYRIGIAVGLVFAVLGLVFAWKKGKPVYSVTATIYIAPRFVNVLKEPKDFDVTSYQQYRQFVEHQSKTIGRFDILLRALKSLGDRRYSWQLPDESDRRAAERLMAALKIVAIKDTYLITVSLESDKPENLDAIVNAVIENYIATTRQETLFYERDTRLNSLTERRDVLMKAIEARKARRNEIVQELGVNTFSGTAPNPFDTLLMDSRNALAEAHRNTIAAEADLEMATTKSEGAERSSLTALAADMIAKDAGLNSLRGSLYARRAELLQQLSGLDESHPLRRKIQRELDEIQAELDRASTNLLKQTEAGLLEQRRAEVRKARRVEQALEKQIEVQQAKGAWFARLYDEALAINSELERFQKQLEEIDNRLDFFQVESAAPGYIRFESPARPPEEPVSGGRKKLAIISLLAAILAGLGVPIAIDQFDRRIRTAGQAAKVLGHAPMAAFFEPSTDIDWRRIDADRKRRLAIALDRELRQQQNRVILLTSVRPGAGVTGLAFELANQMAELGERSLVIEANPLKPDPRYHAEFGHGLVDVLVGEERLEDAIMAPDGHLPARIGIGFAGMPHLHNYGVLRGLLEELKTQYDVILLDAPPVLLSADTEYLVSLADITLLLIAARDTLPTDIKRAIDTLQKTDPKTIGFIVTRLEIYRGVGDYDQMMKDYGATDQAAREVLKSHPLRQKPT